MYKYIVFSVCVYFIYGFKFENDEDKVETYFWKEFNGVIPKNAVPGGTNRKGSVTYIGQVFAEKSIIPAKIDIDDGGSVSYEWYFKEHFITKNINILCSDHRERLQWVNSSNGWLYTLKDKHLVRGGFEEGGNIFIGRLQLDDELSLGKIREAGHITTLNTIRDGVGTQHTVFQVLVYNPNLPIEKTICERTAPVIINFYG